MTVAAMATTMAITAQANASVFTVPHEVAVVAHTGIQHEPPLRSAFSSAFDADWSEATERRLLANLESMEREFTKEQRETQAIDSIYSNQIEDVSDQAGRLSKEEIRKIVRRRK